MIAQILKKLLVAAPVLIAVSAPAAASTSGYGVIETVYGTRNGAVLFKVTGATAVRSNDMPSCGASNPQRWAIDASTIAGQAAVQVLMAAYAQHKFIFVSGTGNCSIWGDTETVDFFNLSDS